MPKNNPQPLPEYSSLIRWTVQDVINWLTQNSLINSIRIFRDAGVDGNKLLNITSTDLRQIRCPNKEQSEIMKFVNAVQIPLKRPGQNRPMFASNQSNFIPQANDDEDSEDEMWSDNEFDNSDFEDNQGTGSDSSYETPANEPGPPPRSNRAPAPRQQQPLPKSRAAAPTPSRPRAPPATPPESEDTYEDPDLSAKVQHVHGGPLPPLPTMGRPPPISRNTQQYTALQKHNSPVGRKKVPVPPLSSSSDTEETYTEPTADSPPQPPVPSSIPKPKRANKLQPPPPVDDQEQVYEEPEEEKPPPVPRSAPKRTKQPKTPVIEQEQVYEEPEEEKPPPVPRSAPKRTKQPKTPVIEQEQVYEQPEEEETPPPVPRSVPKRGKQQKPPVIDQDVYEVPDEMNKQEDAEDYLDMTNEMDTLPAVPARPESDVYLEMTDEMDATTPPSLQCYPQEDYEEPDLGLQQNKPRGVPMGKAVLPGMKDLNIAEKAPKKAKEIFSQRSLPQPPTASAPKVPVNKQPARGGGSYTQVILSNNTGPVIANNVHEMTEADYERQRWYHKKTSRLEAQQRLKTENLDGMYLIRKSSQGPEKPYTLQIFYNGQDYNLPIRRRKDNKFAVGTEKTDEQSFSNLLELVNFFKQNYLLLKGGVNAKLLRSLPQNGS